MHAGLFSSAPDLGNRQIVVLGALLSLIASHALAQVAKVGSRAALAGNVTIEWFEFGRDGAFISTPLSRRYGDLKVTLGSSSGGLLLKREGTSWTGDFTPGQFLMTQPYQSDNFIVSFAPPVSAVGTQIDPGSGGNGQQPYTGAFAARLCLYGVGGALLGSVQTASMANAAEDGSARFIGARSAGAPISFVVLQVSGVTPGFSVEGDLAIDRMEAVLPIKTAKAEATPAEVEPQAACR